MITLVSSIQSAPFSHAGLIGALFLESKGSCEIVTDVEYNFKSKNIESLSQ